MRKKRTPIMLVLTGLIASLITSVSSGTAVAAESLPEMQWTPVQAEAFRYPLTTSPQGDVTIGCGSVVSDYPQDVVTWGTDGAETRHLSRTPQVDGKDNCIDRPVVDKNGDLYGGLKSGYLYGYDSNTLKWKYSTGCTYYLPRPVIGADGNVYFVNNSGRLVGLTPDVQPPLTTPAKVLDVPGPNGTRCGTEVRAFKEGLAVMGDNFWVYFYAYDGTYLGSKNANDAPAVINAAGRLFSPTWTGSGDNRGIQISAYDPITKKVAWTAQESSFGQAVSLYRTYPTPDGGAVVHVQRTKVVSGAPTSERVHALVKLNASGIKMWDQDLPNTDASGVNTAGNNYITVDTTGKLVLVRDWRRQLTSYPWQVPFITVNVLNVATGEAVSSPKVMSGNIASSEGEVYGYEVKKAPVIGPNTVYVPAQKCSRYCYGDGETKIYPIAVPEIGMDYPRGAVLTVPPLKPYVALGDSFSSGQGAGIYDADTVTDTNECYKSYNGYGRILGRDTSSPLMLTNFAACGGSITDNIDTNTTYPGVSTPQTSALSSDTEIVSLTVGGNDIGFSDVVITCVKASVGVGDCDAAVAEARQKLQGLPVKLNRVYADILSKTNSQNGGADAEIYVLGYAPLLSADAPDCMINDYPFGGEDKTAAIQLLNDLNQAISDTVGAVNNPRIHYVNPMSTNSPFLGRSLCTSEPYFNGLTIPSTADSFHPNAKGQKAYADLLAQYMMAN